MKLCKTRAKKSSPDMFNFYVDLAGKDMVADASGTTRAGAKSMPMITNKITKNEGPLEKNGFQRENRLKISDKKNKNFFYPRPINPVEHTALKNNN